MTFKFSPSSLNLMKDCPRCFWLHFNRNVRRPAGIFPSLPSGMDRVLKNHFNKFRDKKQLPPELCNHKHCKNMKLFEDKELLKVWQNNLRGIQWKDKEGNLLRGAVDNILVKGKKLIVLDYKTRGYPLKEDTAKYYQNQLDIYNFLLRKNDYKTEDYGFLIFYIPNEVTKTGEVIFDTELVKMKIDVKNAENILKNALKILKSEIPKHSKECIYCKFLKDRSSQFESIELIDPKTPFSNQIKFIRVLENAEEHIHWIDKYFSKKGLELLSNAVEPEKVSEIKIIQSIEKADEDFRKLLKEFKKEMKHKGIDMELRVIVDSKIKSSIHDRFIISKYSAFNVPSPDVMARDQLSEIKESKNIDVLQEKFKDIWDKSLDIIEDWNKIKEKKDEI